MMASTEGGMDIEKVAEENPEKIFKVTLDPSEEDKRLSNKTISFNLIIPKEALKVFQNKFICYLNWQVKKILH